MRLFFQVATVSGLAALSACGGGSAEVTGTAGGITFGETEFVYFGGPYVIISQVEAECDEFAWVERNYEVGQSPTETDVAALQFAYSGETLVEGAQAIAVDASVAATVLNVKDVVFSYERAEAGFITMDEVIEDESASGTFEGLTFEDGTLNGSFTAEWCRNLKD